MQMGDGDVDDGDDESRGKVGRGSRWKQIVIQQSETGGADAEV